MSVPHSYNYKLLIYLDSTDPEVHTFIKCLRSLMFNFKCVATFLFEEYWPRHRQC
jgi:hypothetical protein